VHRIPSTHTHTHTLIQVHSGLCFSSPLKALFLSVLCFGAATLYLLLFLFFRPFPCLSTREFLHSLFILPCLFSFFPSQSVRWSRPTEVRHSRSSSLYISCLKTHTHAHTRKSLSCDEPPLISTPSSSSYIMCALFFSLSACCYLVFSTAALARPSFVSLSFP
jgi:hypothetical protein